MLSLLKRRRKALAALLVLLNLSGARLVLVSAPSERCHAYFAPGRGFRAITKTVARREWKRSARKVLGITGRHRHSSRDVVTLREEREVAPAAAPAPFAAREPKGSSDPRPRDWKLPSDVDPTRSPHLQSKK